VKYRAVLWIFAISVASSRWATGSA
jgi:hypothetical protein